MYACVHNEMPWHPMPLSISKYYVCQVLRGVQSPQWEGHSNRYIIGITISTHMKRL